MISFGVDVLLSKNVEWKKQRIALVTNHAATTNQLQPSRKALLDTGFNIIKLFSPEHGLDVKGVDGATIKDGIDELTQLPVISLYNEKLQPDENDLNDVNIVLFDIPDIGCRCYTYLWTMTYVLEACVTYKKRFIILDRPNPVSGSFRLAEGPMLDEENCTSFIGRWNIPLRHSCTIGELALYFNTTKNIHAAVEVIKCRNWGRTMFQPDWQIPFVSTSPAIQKFNAMMLYPGLVLLEATNISEGRGTDFPFQMAGAPWTDANLLIKTNNFMATAVYFVPTESKYAKEVCFGLKFESVHLVRSVMNGLIFIKNVYDLFTEHFKWNTYPTNVNPTGANHLDKLLGIYKSEALFETGPKTFAREMNELTTVKKWRKEVEPYLLY
jgi:uncharacterized protein YbbC (DUF1343 family)